MLWCFKWILSCQKIKSLTKFATVPWKFTIPWFFRSILAWSKQPSFVSVYDSEISIYDCVNRLHAWMLRKLSNVAFLKKISSWETLTSLFDGVLPTAIITSQSPQSVICLDGTLPPRGLLHSGGVFWRWRNRRKVSQAAGESCWCILILYDGYSGVYSSSAQSRISFFYAEYFLISNLRTISWLCDECTRTEYMCVACRNLHVVKRSPYVCISSLDTLHVCACESACTLSVTLRRKDALV